jgi:transketolase
MATDPRQQLAVHALKALAMDGVQKANSGHPGMPMGMADIAVTVWTRFLTVDPDEPTWPDRDRFVLSNGHGSMLLYGLLHLSGFPVGLDDLRAFRQLGSKTPGHPEREPHLGIEVTTGPLGQGFGMGVGLAIAEEHLRARFGPELVDHRTFGFVSDGDLMEGISAEASSLAGHLGLGRLVYFYDSNRISIDGSTEITFTEDVARRFQAVGWHVEEVDGHDRQAVAEAAARAVDVAERPSLVICHTHIAHGAPNAQDTAKSHGSPLGDEEIGLTKEAMGWPHGPFEIPGEVYAFFTESMQRGRDARAAWERRRSAAFGSDPELASVWEAYHRPGPIRLDPPRFEVGASVATRAASGKLFDPIATAVPGFIGGAADLVESTKTTISSTGYFSREDRLGRNLAFGIREHAMGAIVNGMAVHGGLRPYGSTFLVFSDYMRPAIRISALMAAPSLWVFTHDSVFLGEDGPTHQPIEHLASLRAMPNLWVIRPADAGETVEAWELALNRTDGPVALALTRQGVPVLDRTGREGGVARGGYVLRDGDDVVLVASGSEVHVALEAAGLLEEEGVSARVVSLPCWERFFEQDEGYRLDVLGEGIPRIGVEAAATFGWERIVGPAGTVLGIDRFGASAPAGDIAVDLGFTGAGLAALVRRVLSLRHVRHP